MKGIILPLVLAGGAVAGEAITLNTQPTPTDWVEAVKQALVVYENQDTFITKVALTTRQQ